MYRYLSFFCVLGFLLITGCSSSNHGGNPPYKKQNEVSRITNAKGPSNMRAIKDIPQFKNTEHFMAPGFLFALSHPADDKIKGTFRAQIDGVLILPYGVRLSVIGLTFSELRDKVLKAYNSFFQRGVQNVSFSLLRKEYWVEVRGFVKKPGTYLVKRNESIDKVIDSAGGLAGNIKQDFFVATVKQQKFSYSVSLNQYYENNALGVSFVWTGGDTVFINLSNEDAMTQVAPTVEVIGGVGKPGKTFYRENANIFYYLSKRGGVIPNLGYEEAFVIRNGANGLERINFNITKMETIPTIKPGDTIMLNGERQTVWDKIWLRATQVGSLITTIAVLVLAL